MSRLLLNTIALEPNRWTAEKTPHFDLEDLLAPIAESGFGAVEVWQHHLMGKTEPEVDRLFEVGSNLGLSFPIVGLYPVLHHSGVLGYRELDEIDWLLDKAQILGAEVVKIFVGNQASDTLSPHDYRHSLATLRSLIEEADARGLTLAGETHEQTLFDSVEACQTFRANVDREAFKICFQPYDFTSTARTIGDYQILANDVIHIHLQGRRDDAMILLENADIDYAAFLHTLAQHHFDGFLGIEFVQDCVVDDPADFDLQHVLANAHRDRDFIVQAAAEANLCLTVA